MSATKLTVAVLKNIYGAKTQATQQNRVLELYRTWDRVMYRADTMSTVISMMLHEHDTLYPDDRYDIVGGLADVVGLDMTAFRPGGACDQSDVLIRALTKYAGIELASQVTGDRPIPAFGPFAASICTHASSCLRPYDVRGVSISPAGTIHLMRDPHVKGPKIVAFEEYEMPAGLTYVSRQLTQLSKSIKQGRK